MSRHTTSFTTHPRYRAAKEVRNRLERIREEAQTTADCFQSVDAREYQMWREVVSEAEELIGRIDAVIEGMRTSKGRSQKENDNG